MKTGGNSITFPLSLLIPFFNGLIIKIICIMFVCYKGNEWNDCCVIYVIQGTIITIMENTKVILTIERDQNGSIVGVTSKNILVLEKEGKGYFFVRCPVFKTLGCSTVSYEEAQKDHDIDLKLFFKVHIKRDTLESTLNAFGWRKGSDSSYRSPDIANHIINHAKVSPLSYAYK